jgi:hydroxyethylthiazole kinase-like uncharacterized protein yjeF
MTTPSLATALFTVAQMRELDRHALQVLGIDENALMARAADAALRSLRRRWPSARRLQVLCGAGNNGGDGYLLALQAHEAGMAVTVVALAPSDGAARGRYLAAGGKVVGHWANEHADVIVDAIFGIGLARAPAGAVADVIAAVNDSGVPVLAIDVPSGLSADTGTCPGVAILATATVSFIGWKRGLFTQEAADHCGELELASLGLDDAAIAHLTPDATLMTPHGLPRRPRMANKGLYGHVLAIGGNHGTGGAILLAATAALRTGAGLVSVATRAENIVALHAARPELMPFAVDGPQSLEDGLAKASVLAVGPGMGQGAWGHALWLTALDSGKPLVLDADGLNLLAATARRFTTPVVLTPHPGEAGRLLGCSTPELQADRFASVRELARRYNAVVVLKGSGSLVAAPDGRLDVCPWGNPGMAGGGMGDLLTGIIAGLMAQGEEAFAAASLGVALHARAGDIAARQGERGLLAGDLLDPLRGLVNGIG